VLLDAAGRRRSPATMPGYHARRQPGNKGMQAANLSDRITGESARRSRPAPAKQASTPDLRDARASSVPDSAGRRRAFGFASKHKRG
jgi:hypothetical protein